MVNWGFSFNSKPYPHNSQLKAKVIWKSFELDTNASQACWRISNQTFWLTSSSLRSLTKAHHGPAPVGDESVEEAWGADQAGAAILLRVLEHQEEVDVADQNADQFSKSINLKYMGHAYNYNFIYIQTYKRWQSPRESESKGGTLLLALYQTRTSQLFPCEAYTRYRGRLWPLGPSNEKEPFEIEEKWSQEAWIGPILCYGTSWRGIRIDNLQLNHQSVQSLVDNWKWFIVCDIYWYFVLWFAT